ncbi:MAG TPA: hypothetical protein VF752_16890, partial [Thermoleophilaceae bacterium]
HVAAHHKHAKHHASQPARIAPATGAPAVAPRAHELGPQPISSSRTPAEPSKRAADKRSGPAATGTQPNDGSTTGNTTAPSVPKGTTDEPGAQPITGSEPVESQGFRSPSQPPAAGGSPTTHAGDTAPPASSGATPVDSSNTYSEPAP